MNKPKPLTKRQIIRKERIEEIEQALKIYIEKLGKTNLNFSYNSILMAVETNFYCTRRYAKEYIDVALYKIGLIKNDLLPLWKENEGRRFELIKNQNQLKKGLF